MNICIDKIPFTFKLLKLINYLSSWNNVFDGRYFKDLEIFFTWQTLKSINGNTILFTKLYHTRLSLGMQLIRLAINKNQLNRFDLKNIHFGAHT